MTVMPGEFSSPEDVVITDDMLTLALQCASQWDSLAHVGYDDKFYNDVTASRAITALRGASRNGIDQALPGAVGRGVLLDIARLRGVEWIGADDEAIGVAELERAEAQQGVRVGTGDVLLFRTGWRRKSVVEGWSAEWMAANPGLALECAEWLCEREVATVASDNWGVEVQPSRTEGAFFPLHCVMLRDVGMMFGEMFDLEALADDCAQDGQWTSSSPARRCGSPAGWDPRRIPSPSSNPRPPQAGSRRARLHLQAASRPGPITVEDSRVRARRAVPDMVWAYVDYGAEDLETLRANRARSAGTC